MPACDSFGAGGPHAQLFDTNDATLQFIDCAQHQVEFCAPATVDAHPQAHKVVDK